MKRKRWLGLLLATAMMLALLPKLSEGSVNLMKAESPGPISTKLRPRTGETARILYRIYIALTVAEALLLRIAGLPLFDAITTALTTISTGGFSIRDASIAYYQSHLVNWILIFFMFAASVNFTLLYLCVTRRFREALKSGRDIEQLLVARGELSGSAREIVQMAKERRVPVKEVDRARLDAITRNHQGMLAFASAYRYSTVEDMLDLARERGEAPFLILLDGITDPHNLGAIIRTAECAGAHGVIVQERRAVGLTPAAVKASAGAVEYLPVARVTNLTSTIERLKREGIWTYAADMDGEDYADLDLSGPIALVIGAEGEGVSRRVLESCDRTISVPIRGKLDSLNASVAAGVLMYAVLRAR